MTETIEGEATEVGQALDRYDPGQVTLFGTDDPAEIIGKATRMADALMNVVRSKQLAKRIGPKDYLLVEAWTCLGSLVGVYPRTVWTKPLDDGWEARVEAVTRDGSVVGAAEAECLRSERNWKNRDDYALRSMAQTRAMGKALRMPLGFIAVLAGFEATPAEEMPAQEDAGAEGSEQPAAPTPPVSDPGTVVFPAGPHKGQTIAAVWNDNPGYVSAAAGSAKDKKMKQALTLYLQQKRAEGEQLSDELPF